MRRLILAAVFAAALGVGLSAQQWIGGACQACGVISYVDIASADLIAGWGFECVSGEAVDRVTVSYQGNDGWFHSVPPTSTVLYWGLLRPDVYHAFVGHCPAVTALVGWHLYLPAGAIPSGTRTIAIQPWRGPYFETHYRTVTIQ